MPESGPDKYEPAFSEPASSAAEAVEKSSVVSQEAAAVATNSSAEKGTIHSGGLIRTSLSHQILTLVGAGFLCFELVFLYMYFDPFWFGIDLSMFGLPAILASLIAGHIFLMFGESNYVARVLSFILKGRPATNYRKWITLEDDAFSFGIRRVRFKVIDELELSWFGNLIIKSRFVCGDSAQVSDVLLKLPFAAASFADQERLLYAIKSARPDLKMNKRLLIGRNATWQQGTQVTQMVTAGLMSLLLLDVGFSSFYYLELLKHFYLAETYLLADNRADSDKHFARAEDLRLHPLPLSWVSSKFLNSSNVSSGIWDQRSKILWLQGKHEEALANSQKSIDESPTNLRHRLLRTRMLEADNKTAESEQQLEQILKDHKHSLLPRLYILAIEKERNPAALNAAYKQQMDPCFEDTYENEPHWPPGGNRYFMELLYSDDVVFLLNRFLGSKYDLPPFVSRFGEAKEKVGARDGKN